MSGIEFLNSRLRQVNRFFDLIAGRELESFDEALSAAGEPPPSPTPSQHDGKGKKKGRKGKVKPGSESPAMPSKGDEDKTASMGQYSIQSGGSSYHHSPTSSTASTRSDSISTTCKTPESPQTTVPSTTSSPIKSSKKLPEENVRFTCGGVEWHRVFGKEKMLTIRPVKGETVARQQTRAEFMSMLYLDALNSEELGLWFAAFMAGWSTGKRDSSIKLPRQLDENHPLLRKLKRFEFLGPHAAEAAEELFGARRHEEQASLSFLNRLNRRQPPNDDMWELKMVVAAHLWAAYSDRGTGVSKEMLEVLKKIDVEFEDQRDGLDVDWVLIHNALSNMLNAGCEGEVQVDLGDTESGESEDHSGRASHGKSSSTSPAQSIATSSELVSAAKPNAHSSSTQQESPLSKAFSRGFLKRGMPTTGTSTSTAAPHSKDQPEDLPKVTHPGYPWRLAGPPNPHSPIYCREIPMETDMGIDAPPIEGLSPPPPPEVLAAPGFSGMFAMPPGFAMIGLERVRSGHTNVGRVRIAPACGVVKDEEGCFSLSGSFDVGVYRCPCRVCRGSQRPTEEAASTPKPPAATKPKGKAGSGTKNDKTPAGKPSAKPNAASKGKKSKASTTPDAADPLPSPHSEAGRDLINQALRCPTGNSLFDDPVRHSVGAATLRLVMDRLGLLPDRDLWVLMPSCIISPDLCIGIADVMGVLLGGPVDGKLMDRCEMVLGQVSRRLKMLSHTEKVELKRVRNLAELELSEHPTLRVKGGDVGAKEISRARVACRSSSDQHSSKCLRNKLLIAANDERERRAVYLMLQAGLSLALGSQPKMGNVKLEPPAIIDLTCVDYSLVAWKPFTERAPGQASFERGVRASPLAFRRYDVRKGWERSWDPYEAHESWPGPGWIRVYLEDVLECPATAADDHWPSTFSWVPENHFLRHVKPGSSADRWLAGFEENPALEALFGKGKNGHRWPTFDGAEVATLGAIIRDVEEGEKAIEAAIHGKHPVSRSSPPKAMVPPVKETQPDTPMSAPVTGLFVSKVEAPAEPEDKPQGPVGSPTASSEQPKKAERELKDTEAQTSAPQWVEAVKNVVKDLGPMPGLSEPRVVMATDVCAALRQPEAKSEPMEEPKHASKDPGAGFRLGEPGQKDKEERKGKGQSGKGSDACAKHQKHKLKGKAPVEEPVERKRKRRSETFICFGTERIEGPSSPSRDNTRLATLNGPRCNCGGLHEDGSRSCNSRPLTAAHLQEKEVKIERARLEAERAKAKLARSSPPPPPLLDAPAAKQRLAELRDDLVALLDGKELRLDRPPDGKSSVSTALWLLDSLATLSQSHTSVVKDMKCEGEAFQKLELQMEEAWGRELIEGISRSVELVAFVRDFLPRCRGSPEEAAELIFSRWIQPIAMILAGHQMRAGNDLTDLLGSWNEVASAEDAESRLSATVRLTQQGELHRLAERLDALADRVTPQLAKTPHEVHMVSLLLSGGLKMLYHINKALTQLPADIVLNKTQHRRWARKGRGGAAIPEEDESVSESEGPWKKPTTASNSPVQDSESVHRSGKKPEKLHKRRSAGRCRMPLV